MSKKKTATALAAALLVAAGLELLARKGPACPGGYCPTLNSDGFPGAEWEKERTPGVRRVVLMGAMDPTLARELAKDLSPFEVLDMTAAPPERALAAAARYRPDYLLHGLARSSPSWSCPSRALTYAVARGRALLAPELGDAGPDDGGVARTRKLCELREAAASFGARAIAIISPDASGRFEGRARRSCDTAGVRAIVAGEGVASGVRALCDGALKP